MIKKKNKKTNNTESKKQLLCCVYNIYYLSKVKRKHTVYNTWTTRGCLEIDGKLEI